MKCLFYIFIVDLYFSTFLESESTKIECCSFQLLIRGLPSHLQNYAQLPFKYFIKYVTNEPQILGFHVWRGNWVPCLSVSRTEWTSEGELPSCEAEWNKTKILASKAGGGTVPCYLQGALLLRENTRGIGEKQNNSQYKIYKENIRERLLAQLEAELLIYKGKG